MSIVLSVIGKNTLYLILILLDGQYFNNKMQLYGKCIDNIIY